MALVPLFQTPFVGRKDECTFYQRFLSQTTPWVWLILGQGGIGKSRLLDQLSAETPQEKLVVRLNFAMSNMRGEPLSVLEEMLWQVEASVDADQMRLCQQAFAEGKAKLERPVRDIRQEIHLAEDASLQGQGMQLTITMAELELRRDMRRSLTQAFYSLISTLTPAHLVLLLDTCEWLGELEGLETGQWLLNDLLPTLHQRLQRKQKRCSVVLASRMKLPFSTLQNQEVRVYPLAFLDRPAVNDYLMQIGMQDAPLRQRIYEITYGHALCVELFGLIWQERGDSPFTIADLPQLQDQFNERALLDYLQDRLYQRLASPFRELTKYSSLLRRFDLPLLEAVFADLLPENKQADLFEQFVQYPFIEKRGNQRYACHDLLRELQAARIQAQEPSRWNDYHQRALTYFEQAGLRSSPDWYYHALILNQEEAMQSWKQEVQEASFHGKRAVWRELLQVSYDPTLNLTAASRAARAQWQGLFSYYEAPGDSAALASYEEALGLYRAVGDRLGEANVLQAMGRLAAKQEQYASALVLFSEAYQLYQTIQDRYSQSVTLYYRSAVYETLKHCADALADMQKAVEIARQLRLPWMDEWSQRLETLQKKCDEQ
jgi:hypothetical protein